MWHWLARLPPARVSSHGQLHARLRVLSHAATCHIPWSNREWHTRYRQACRQWRESTRMWWRSVPLDPFSEDFGLFLLLAISNVVSSLQVKPCMLKVNLQLIQSFFLKLCSQGVLYCQSSGFHQHFVSILHVHPYSISCNQALPYFSNSTHPIYWSLNM